MSPYRAPAAQLRRALAALLARALPCGRAPESAISMIDSRPTGGTDKERTP
ncbi:hypothetical protein [Streptomyces orinoci]|uniref:Uncharacterized protein n=1 Tax=Streptomyces orinoci TaxID=67339 RepID=A0ABV3JXH9_STRON|nr:hypothetical protein [Streptomyces orinoci]